MADASFNVWGKYTEGLVVPVGDEHYVVAKAVGPDAVIGKPPFHGSAYDDGLRSRRCESGATHEARRAPFIGNALRVF